MDDRPHVPAPFTRDPRSLPLYVPLHHDPLPLWPASWRLRSLFLVALAFLAWGVVIATCCAAFVLLG